MIFTAGIKHQIEEAYRRNAALDAHGITVYEQGGEVVRIIRRNTNASAGRG